MTDPAYVRIEEIAWSTEGRTAAVEATRKGLPALAGIEPLIVASLGKRYHPHDGGTTNAGFIVAEVMRHMGFVDAGEGKMPGESTLTSRLLRSGNAAWDE